MSSDAALLFGLDEASVLQTYSVVSRLLACVGDQSRHEHGPTEEFAKTAEVVDKNMGTMGGGV